MDTLQFTKFAPRQPMTNTRMRVTHVLCERHNGSAFPRPGGHLLIEAGRAMEVPYRPIQSGKGITGTQEVSLSAERAKGDPWR